MKEKFDKIGRLIKKIDLSSGLIYKYKYDENKRIVNIFLKNKKSHAKTIISEVLENDVYIIVDKKDYSDKYIFTYFYDGFGREKKIIRFNRKSRKKYVRENLFFNDKTPIFWIEHYSGKKDFGFKLDLAKH